MKDISTRKAKDEAVIPAARNRHAENTIYNNNTCHPGGPGY